MLGFALRELRKELGWKQINVALAVGVTQAAVSQWERTGVLPEDQIQPILKTFEITLPQLRAALVRALRGHTVDSLDKLDVWRDAVSLSDLPPTAKVVLFQMSTGPYRNEDWYVEVSKDELRASAATKLEAAWTAAIESPFVQAIGTGGAFKLRFPEG